jgi:hypothetical protein
LGKRLALTEDTPSTLIAAEGSVELLLEELLNGPIRFE